MLVGGQFHGKHSYFDVTLNLCYLKLVYFFFSHILYYTYSLPSLLSSESLLPLSSSPSCPPDPFFFFVSLQKMAGLPGISIKRSISSCNKTKDLSSYLHWMRQRGRRKGSQKQTKESEMTAAPTRRPSYKIITYLQKAQVRPMQAP